MQLLYFVVVSLLPVCRRLRVNSFVRQIGKMAVNKCIGILYVLMSTLEIDMLYHGFIILYYIQIDLSQLYINLIIVPTISILFLIDGILYIYVC